MRFSKLFIVSVLIVSAMGCGGGSSITVPPPPPPPPPTPTSVSVTFVGSGGAVALQMGTDPFTLQTLQNGQLSLTLPSATSKYAIAWGCSSTPLINNQFVLEATPQDGTAVTVFCPGGFAQFVPPPGAFVQVNGTVDASAIAGTHSISIYGLGGSGSLIGASGLFAVSLVTGTNDVAFLALDSSNNVLAVKILRNQTVPGAVNSGNPVIFGPGDMVTPQPLTLSNIPTGFLAPPDRQVRFQTANGISFPLVNSDTTQYAAVPAAAFQTGDTYLFSTQTRNDTTMQHLAVTESSTTGGPITLAFPQPWSNSGPVPAALPTFPFIYSGFTSLPLVTQHVSFGLSGVDAGEPFSRTIEVLATGSYQNGGNTITIPDLTSVGFQRVVGSGTTVPWSADIAASSGPEVQFLKGIAPNSSVFTVSTSGSFTVP